MSVPKLRFPEFRDSGEWEEKKLGEVATFYNGKAYKQEELLDQGKYRVLRVGNFFTNNNWYYSDLELDDTKYCDYGDLLYAWSASFAPRVWDGEKIIYHYHIWKVVEKKNIDKKFLFIILEHETERLKDQSANGLGLLHITKGTIEGWKCGFPTLPEQKKIADCLTSIADRITAETQKLDTLKAHKKGLMQQLFPAEGETMPKLRFPEFQDAGEWEEKELGEISRKIMVGIASAATHAYRKSGIILFRNQNIKEGYLDDSDILFIDEDYEKLHKSKRLKSGDLLTARTGYPGTTCVVPEKYEGSQSFTTLITRPNNSIVNSEYLCIFINSEKGQAFFNSTKIGGGQKNVNAGSLVVMPILYPSHQEQQKIADCLSSIDEAIAAQSQAIDLLKLHKKGLMQQLFPSVEEVNR
jgi:type I restriction enzyme S subunit